MREEEKNQLNFMTEQLKLAKKNTLIPSKTMWLSMSKSIIQDKQIKVIIFQVYQQPVPILNHLSQKFSQINL